MTTTVAANALPASPRGRRHPRSAQRAYSTESPARGLNGSGKVLARYTALAGAPREVIAVDGAGGCVLVVDRNRITCDDARLVAHLAADEPPENAAIAGALFAQHASEQHVRCRPVLAADFAALASREGGDVELSAPGPDGHGEIRDRLGRTYRLEAVARAASIPELRWRRHPPLHEAGASATVSVREAIGAVQAYEPIRALTRIALATRGARGDVSVAVLRLELQRLLCSPIVLNGKLRETVARLVAQQGLSLSEIAIRCGRVKRDVRGGVSGETSWLGRRLGVLPEGGRAAPTPWIHTEVLALIARRGLGVSPREVEPD